MIEHDIITNDGSFADDYTGTVVDKEPFANLRSRMNFDAAGHQTGELGDETWQEGNVRFIERVGDAVVEDGPQALVQ